MSLAWFAGASERKNQALQLLEQLQTSLEDQAKAQSLQQVLKTYQDELSGNATGVPLILSRLQVEVSQMLTDYPLILNAQQENLFKQLRELSQVRYG